VSVEVVLQRRGSCLFLSFFLSFSLSFFLSFFVVVFFSFTLLFSNHVRKEKEQHLEIIFKKAKIIIACVLAAKNTALENIEKCLICMRTVTLKYLSDELFISIYSDEERHLPKRCRARRIIPPPPTPYDECEHDSDSDPIAIVDEMDLQEIPTKCLPFMEMVSLTRICWNLQSATRVVKLWWRTR